MTRAVFNVEPQEFRRAEQKVQEKKKRKATIKEIMKEANSVIPSPDILRTNVEAVLKYVQDKDTETEHKLSTWVEGDNGPKPERFLKSIGVRDRCRKQFKHIDKGCLSDPPSNLVNIFRWNACKDVCYVARGTNTNERDNFDLGNKILTATHIGIHRADRLMCCFFEHRNHQKSITRLGQEDYGTHQTEQLLMLNGAAMSAGYSKDNLPFPSVSAPTTRTGDIKEFIGFCYALPSSIHNVSNPTESRFNNDSTFDGEEDDVSEGGNEEIDDGDAAELSLAETFGDDFDVEVLLTETGYLQPTEESAREINRELQLLERHDIADANDRLNMDKIQNELWKLLPINSSPESTLNAFKRLTEKHPWFPLRAPDSTSPKTDVDKEEEALFASMKGNYCRYADPDAVNGFKAFEREWNNEVSRRFKAWSTGDEEIVQIRLKKWEFLQQHYDKTLQDERLRATIPRDDPSRLILDNTLRQSRRQLPTMVTPHQVRPPTYRQDGQVPFGSPTVLNSYIAMGAVTGFNRGITGVVDNRLVAPMQFCRPPLQLPLPPPKRTPVFRSRKYCKTCGWRRNSHRPEEGVNSTCIRTYCGKCYQLKEHHSNNLFGTTCTNPTNNYCFVHVNDWYSEGTGN
jgi:hypothetical protein